MLFRSQIELCCALDSVEVTMSLDSFDLLPIYGTVCVVLPQLSRVEFRFAFRATGNCERRGLNDMSQFKCCHSSNWNTRML